MFAINYRTKLGFVRIHDLYYSPALQPPPAGLDVVYYYHCQVSEPGAKPFHTLLVDVSQGPEDLLASFQKSARSDIRQVLRDDSVKITITPVCNTAGKGPLQAFVEGYNHFASFYSLKPTARW